MNDLTTIETGLPTGAILRDPAVIMEEAKERSQMLTKMVEQTHSFTQIGQGKHLRVEAWITLGAFYGCTGRIVKTEDIEIGGELGFKAHAQVVHDQTGNILSSADAICMRDEDNWRNKPLHQVMSMAGTRALSKALATKFRWIVVLGGFSPTPAEEMTGREQEPKPQAKPKGKQPERIIPYGPAKGKRISEAETDHLRGFVDSAERRLAEGKVPQQFIESNTALIAAIKAELATREPEQTEDHRPPMEDSPWADFCIVAQEEYANSLDVTLKEFTVKTLDKVQPEDRWRFYDSLNAKVSG